VAARRRGERIGAPSADVQKGVLDPVPGPLPGRYEAGQLPLVARGAAWAPLLGSPRAPPSLGEVPLYIGVAG